MRADGDEQFVKVKTNPIVELDNTFIQAVKTADQSLLKSDYADAVKSLQVVLAANQSMGTGEVVTLG